MSDDNAKPADAEVEAAIAEQKEFLSDPVSKSYNWDGANIDGFLQRLVNLANGDLQLEFGLTLNVDGQVITGTLISRKTFFKEFAAVFSAGFPGGDEEGVVRKTFEEFGTPKPGGEEFPPQFICLKNAKYVMGNSHVPIDGMLWRGKINSVSGFSLGSFKLS